MKENRPWGYFETLLEGDGYKVKRILVKPAQRLSLQSHQKRSEHWTVVVGTATITVGDSVKDYKHNQSVYIEKEQKHRVENKTAADVQIIEVQCGTYLGEDDIVRYEDDYNRG
ncbi:MAG: phosphomannose isomerase type II C-terminal cupin domain [Pseudomonadota bacterium]